MYNLTINHTYVIDILLPTYSLRFLYFPGAVKKLGYTEDKVIKKNLRHVPNGCASEGRQQGKGQRESCRYKNRILLACKNMELKVEVLHSKIHFA